MSVDRGSGGVEFSAIGRPSALKIHGKGALPHGQLILSTTSASGNLTFDLDSLDTGIKMRNEHMKQKYLETGKYSQATLILTHLSTSDSLLSGDAKMDSVPFAGTLTLHGIQKPVTGIAKLQRNANQMSIEANFGIKIADYGISIPTFAGITMADDVTVAVQISAPLTAQE